MKLMDWELRQIEYFVDTNKKQHSSTCTDTAFQYLDQLLTEYRRLTEEKGR